jgi:hypothetical protein
MWRYPGNWKARALISLSLLLLLLSGPRGIALLTALVLPILGPAVVLFGAIYRVRKRWRR